MMQNKRLVVLEIADGTSIDYSIDDIVASINDLTNFTISHGYEANQEDGSIRVDIDAVLQDIARNVRPLNRIGNRTSDMAFSLDRMERQLDKLIELLDK